MTKPELIIFDLGRVLIDFDFMKAIRGLKKHTSLNTTAIRNYFRTTPLWDRFERGTIDTPDFFKALTKDLKLRDLEFKTFEPMWNDIFEEIPESVSIVKQLKKRFRLAMISNVNPMHWKHVRKNHTFMELFDHPIPSYAVGHRKPEPEIFHLTLRKAKVKPERAIFIDDIRAHIVAARSLGMRAHQFKGAKQLARDLKEILE